MFLARAGKKAWCLKMLPTFRSSAQSEVLINPLQLPQRRGIHTPNNTLKNSTRLERCNCAALMHSKHLETTCSIICRVFALQLLRCTRRIHPKSRSDATGFPAQKLDGLCLPVGHCLMATAVTSMTSMTSMMAMMAMMEKVSVDPKMSADAKKDRSFAVRTSREPCRPCRGSSQAFQSWQVWLGLSWASCGVRDR